MALVFVAKDMSVANPVAHMNINQLPQLPSGLEHAYLFRHSLDVSSINLVTGQPTAMVELAGGTFTYHDNRALADPRGAGWSVPGWDFDKGGNQTWMSIGTSVPEGNESNIVLSGGLYETDGAMVDLGIRSQGVYITVRRSSTPGGANVRLEYPGGPPTATPLMVFASIASNHEVTVFDPSTQAVATDTLTEISEVDAAAQTVIAATSSSPDDPKNFDTYMAAGWSRVLSQGEMTAAYNALKPWLASRGVNIA